jgi:hypothetical protein
MRILLDSHLLVWLAAITAKLPKQVLPFIDDIDNVLFIARQAYGSSRQNTDLGEAIFLFTPRILHRALLDNGFQELSLRVITPSRWKPYRQSTRTRSIAS